MNVKTYPLVTYSIESDDIVISTIKNVVDLDILAAKELVACRLDYMKDKRHYVLIDISNVKHYTTEAKQYMQNPETGLKNILGAAFIASDPISTLIANIFIKTKIHFPAKFFFKKADALKWLRELKNNSIE
ncbi:MAG TPA: hypothetical protein VLB84_17030 [Bacteroidia bacterium]|nr:hypothetical protein [Bacteroidia bacterium]